MWKKWNNGKDVSISYKKLEIKVKESVVCIVGNKFLKHSHTVLSASFLVKNEANFFQTLFQLFFISRGFQPSINQNQPMARVPPILSEKKRNEHGTPY